MARGLVPEEKTLACAKVHYKREGNKVTTALQAREKIDSIFNTWTKEVYPTLLHEKRQLVICSILSRLIDMILH